MANWVFTVRDANSGKPIPEAYINLHVDTVAQSGCGGLFQQPCSSTGPGYDIVGSTDSSGQYTSNIPYQCEQNIDGGYVSANGYFQQAVTYQSGYITGDVGINVNLVPSSSQTVLTPPAGQGVGAGQSTLTTQQWLESTGNAWNSGTGFIQDLGMLGVIAVIGIAVVFVVLMVITVAV